MRPGPALVACLAFSVALAGCIATDPASSGTTEDPADSAKGIVDHALPDEIAGLEPVAGVETDGGSGLWIDDGFAFLGGLSHGVYVIDARQPARAELVAQVQKTPAGNPLRARDVNLVEVGDRTIAVGASGGSNMTFVDVTEPTDPVALPNFDVGQPVHNIAVFPNTTLVYNSRSLGDAVEPGIDIVDVSDPSDPEIVTRWTFPDVAAGQPVETTGCHDITIYPEADRAYCAGVTQTYIMNVEDPTDPSIEGVVTNPMINIHHFAVPDTTSNHTRLLIGDEYGGTLLPACYGYEETPAGPVSPPTGALWIYDISDPSQPRVEGYVSAPAPSEGPVSPPGGVGYPVNTCTAHFGQQVPGRQVMAMGWYNAGVLLIDFSDPTRPVIRDQVLEDRNPWDVRYWNGHFITGNIGQGSDVLRIVGG